jgi:hypothetical protein
MVVEIGAVAAHEEHHVGQRPKHRILLQERFTSRPEQDDKRRNQADLQRDNNNGENYVQIRRQAPDPIVRPGGIDIPSHVRSQLQEGHPARYLRCASFIGTRAFDLDGSPRPFVEHADAECA